MYVTSPSSRAHVYTFPKDTHKYVQTKTLIQTGAVPVGRIVYIHAYVLECFSFLFFVVYGLTELYIHSGRKGVFV